MKSIVFTASVVVGAVSLAPACSANPLLVGHEIDAADASGARDAEAVEVGPGDKDGGSDDGGRSGAALLDAGSGRDGGPADAALGHGDGGSTDSGADGGGRACTLAGGTCIGPSVACAVGAPVTAQDCPTQQGPSYCCISTR